MHTHGPRRGVRGVRVCACETIVPPSNTAHPPAHPSSQLPSHTTSKSSTAGCFITLENSQANPYVAGKEPWPKAGDPAGNFQGCTFLLLCWQQQSPEPSTGKAKSTLTRPAQCFVSSKWQRHGAVAGIQDLQPSASLLGFCFSFQFWWMETSSQFFCISIKTIKTTFTPLQQLGKKHITSLNESVDNIFK